ncbi:MAG: ATP-binding cassette domain-containing protein [Verrucomicrobiota bacterium]
MGLRGAGKSTLLKACLDLIPKASGEVRFYGEPYPERATWSATCRSGSIPSLSAIFA